MLHVLVELGGCLRTFISLALRCNSHLFIVRLNVTGGLNISFEPIVIGQDLWMTNDTVTVITPTDNSTLFIVVDGTAHLDGTLIVDLSGRNYSSTYTSIAVVKAGEIDGTFTNIGVINAPKGYEHFLLLLLFLMLIHILGAKNIVPPTLKLVPR